LKNIPQSNTPWGMKFIYLLFLFQKNISCGKGTRKSDK